MTTVHRCPVVLPRPVPNHSVVGEASVRTAHERVGDAFRPLPLLSASQLENGPAAASLATALTRRAVEIAGRVENEVADRAAPVTTTGEAVEHGLMPLAIPERQPVDGAKVVRAGVVGGAIEMAGLVEGQCAVRESRIGLALESVEGRQLPFPDLRLRELEGNARPMRSAHRCDSIQIPGAIEDQPARRSRGPILAAGEGVDHPQLPVVPSSGSQLIDDAEPVGPSRRSHTVDVAVLTERHPCSGTVAIIATGEDMDHVLLPPPT